MSIQIKDGIAEVVAAIAALPNNTIPQHRALHGRGFSFSGGTFQEQLPFWDEAWKQGGYRAKLHSFFFLERYVKDKLLHGALWQTSKAWQEQVDDWSLCDSLAKINTKVLETAYADVYPVLQAWNTDASLWKRRQSVVSLLYFSRTKKVYPAPDAIAALLAPLLADKEYYVQKGVGWALREFHTVYPSDGMAFIAVNVQAISAIAFTIAIEKMSDAEKNVLKQRRKR